MSEKSDKPTQKYVVIGNGFDLNLGLRSSYNQFIEAIQKDFQLRTPKEIYEFNSLFIQSFDGERLNWSDFETVFENQVLEINQQEFMKEDEARRQFLIQKLNNDLKNLETYFHDYLSEDYENWKNKKLSKQSTLNPLYREIFQDSKIITFNYTDSVRDVLEKDRIFNEQNFYQLHGRLADNNIVFGAGFSGTSKVEHLSISGSMDNDKLIRTKHNHLLVEARMKYFSDLNLSKAINNENIDLFILGHSIAGSDLAFLSELFELSTRIYIFYFNEDYLPKLHSISRNLGKHIAEKVLLVPFFDVLIENREEYLLIGDSFTSNNNDSSLAVLNAQHLQKFVDFSVLDIDIFKSIYVKKDFLVSKLISNIFIDSQMELKIFQEILNLSSKKVAEEDSFQVRFENIRYVRGDMDDEEIKEILETPIDTLFVDERFERIIQATDTLEIKYCEFELSSLIKLISNRSFKRIIIAENTIYCKNIKKWDFSELSKIESIKIFNNQFICDSDDIKFTSELRESKKLRQMVLSKNDNVIYSESIYQFSSLAKIVVLPYPILRSDESTSIKFQNASIVKLNGDENNSVPLTGIRFGENIERLELENIPFIWEKEIDGQIKEEPQPLTNLFHQRILPHLKFLSFDTCSVSIEDYEGNPLGLFIDFLKNKTIFSFDRQEYSYSKIWFPDVIEEHETSRPEPEEMMKSSTNVGGSLDKINEVQEDSSENRLIDTMENPHVRETNTSEEPSTKSIVITDEIKQRILLFAQEYAVSEDKLCGYLEHLGSPDILLEPFKKDVIQTADFSSYVDSDGSPLRKLKAKPKLEEALDAFVKRLQEENR